MSPKYEWSTDFSEGLALVRLENKWGFIDKNGQIIIPLEYEEAGIFYEKLAPVEKDGRHFFIDQT